MLEARLTELEIKDVYGRMAPFYDFWAHLTEARARSRALEMSGLQDGLKILEVAVGTGILFDEIVRQNPNGENTGIDLTDAMLGRAVERLAKNRQDNYQLQTGNALALEFEDESFDILFNGYMLDLLSFEDIDSALNEFRRVLKKGGRLVLINMTEGRSPASRFYQTLYKVSPRLMGGCRGLQIRDKVDEKGFHTEYSEYIVQMLFPSEVIVARKR